MKFTIELQRAGMSRVSYDAIPIMARVRQGSHLGENLLPDGLTDVELAKSESARRLALKIGRAVQVDFIDRTKE